VTDNGANDDYNFFHAELAKDVLGSQPSDDDALTLMIRLHTHLAPPAGSWIDPALRIWRRSHDGMLLTLSLRPGRTSRIRSGQTRTIGNQEFSARIALRGRRWSEA
jgi:hypothetical protein